MHRGGGGHHCAHQDAKGPLAPHWKTTLTDEQRAELDKLKLAYMEEKAVVKARARVTKIELAILATADKPDSAAIDRKIGEVLELKRAKLLKKYEYVAAKRGVLTEQQRVSFDMDVIAKAAKGEEKGHGRDEH
jgi:Spy/CpxP family protein refolding chaperone